MGMSGSVTTAKAGRHSHGLVLGCMFKDQANRAFAKLGRISLRCTHRLHPVKEWNLRESRGGSPPGSASFLATPEAQTLTVHDRGNRSEDRTRSLDLVASATGVRRNVVRDAVTERLDYLNGSAKALAKPRRNEGGWPAKHRRRRRALSAEARKRRRHHSRSR